MLETKNLGDFTATATGTAYTVGHLESGSIYASVDGTFVGTVKIEVSFDGSTFEPYGADATAAKTLVGPLPLGVKLVQAHCTAYTSGTISVRLGGNVKRNELLSVQECKSGLFGDIVPTTASQSQTITAVAVASLAAGGGTNDYFSVSDGTTTTTFEYKVDSNYVKVTGRTTIDVSAVSTAIEVAVATAAAIATAYPATLSAPVPTTAVLTVTAAAGYTVIFTEHVSNAGFLLGAVNYGVPVALGGCGVGQVWMTSANFVGTYAIQISFDGGSTWANAVTPVVVASGATSTLTTLPCRASEVRIAATTYTSGTLSARYGAAYETQV